jgi:hypothetical protein
MNALGANPSATLQTQLDQHPLMRWQLTTQTLSHMTGWSSCSSNVSAHRPRVDVALLSQSINVQ